VITARLDSKLFTRSQQILRGERLRALDVLNDSADARAFVRWREFENMRRGGRWFVWYVIRARQH